MTTRADIVTEARSWIGTPFCHGQACRGAGADCIGLVGGVARARRLLGADAWAADVRFRGYGRQPDPNTTLAGCEAYLDPVLLPDVHEADVLLFALLRVPMHFGIVSRVDPMYIVHAWEPFGKVVENAVDQRWFTRIHRAYRFRDFNLDFWLGGPVGPAAGFAIG